MSLWSKFKEMFRKKPKKRTPTIYDNILSEWYNEEEILRMANATVPVAHNHEFEVADEEGLPDGMVRIIEKFTPIQQFQEFKVIANPSIPKDTAYLVSQDGLQVSKITGIE